MASQTPAKEQSKALKPRPVTITTLSTGTATRKVSLLGQVEATQQSTLRSQSSGVVQEILVQPGDRVKTGMVVAILDDSDQKLSIAQAQAQLAQQKSIPRNHKTRTIGGENIYSFLKNHCSTESSYH